MEFMFRMLVTFGLSSENIYPIRQKVATIGAIGLCGVLVLCIICLFNPALIDGKNVYLLCIPGFISSILLMVGANERI